MDITKTISKLLLFSICAASGMQRPSSAGATSALQKVQIERADQVPRHVYRVATTATALSPASK